MLDELLFIPGPTEVPPSVLLASSRPVMGHRADGFRGLYRRLREALSNLLETESDVYILTSSGTGAVEACLSNVVSRGDRVLVPVVGEFSSRMARISEIYGAQVHIVGCELGSAPNLEELLEALDRVKPSVVALVYNDTSPGITLRYLKELAQAAKERGALVVVDAISIVGGERIPVDEWGIDLLAGASQKCLAAPPGVSFVTVSRDAWRKIEARDGVPFYFDLKRYRKFAEKSETPYTPAVTLFYALERALEIILNEVSFSNWVKAHVARSRALYEAFTTLGFRPFVDEAYRSNVVISLEPPSGISPAKIQEELASRYGIRIARGIGELRDRIIRIGNMGVIKPRDIMALIAAVASLVEELGIACNLDEAIKRAERELRHVPRILCSLA